MVYNLSTHSRASRGPGLVYALCEVKQATQEHTDRQCYHEHLVLILSRWLILLSSAPRLRVNGPLRQTVPLGRTWGVWNSAWRSKHFYQQWQTFLHWETGEAPTSNLWAWHDRSWVSLQGVTVDRLHQAGHCVCTDLGAAATSCLWRHNPPSCLRCVDESILWSSDIEANFKATCSFLTKCAAGGVVFNPKKSQCVQEEVQYMSRTSCLAHIICLPTTSYLASLPTTCYPAMPNYLYLWLPLISNLLPLSHPGSLFKQSRGQAEASTPHSYSLLSLRHDQHGNVQLGGGGASTVPISSLTLWLTLCFLCPICNHIL